MTEPSGVPSVSADERFSNILYHYQTAYGLGAFVSGVCAVWALLCVVFGSEHEVYDAIVVVMALSSVVALCRGSVMHRLQVRRHADSPDARREEVERLRNFWRRSDPHDVGGRDELALIAKTRIVTILGVLIPGHVLISHIHPDRFGGYHEPHPLVLAGSFALLASCFLFGMQGNAKYRAIVHKRP